MFLSKIQMVSAFGAVVMALLVLELVRRRRLSEEYSVLWGLATLVVAVLGFSTPLLVAMTRWFGILYESSLVFFAGLAFATAMLLHQSVRLSRLGKDQRLLVREVALLRQALEETRGGPLDVVGERA